MTAPERRSSYVRELLGTDPRELASAMLEYVTAARELVRGVEDEEPPEQTDSRAVAEAFARWERAIYPDGFTIDQLDNYAGRLVREFGQLGVPPILAAFVHVARFRKVGGECLRPISWLLNGIEMLAIGVLNVEQIDDVPYTFEHRRPVFDQAELIRLDIAGHLLGYFELIERNICSPAHDPIKADYDLFALWDQVIWYDERLPEVGIEQFPDASPVRAGRRVGVNGHDAARRLFEQYHEAIVTAGMRKRLASPTAEPDFFFMWTAHARPVPRHKLPRVDLELLRATITIERGKLLKAIGPPPRVRCDASDRSFWLDGTRLVAGLDEIAFAYVKTLADAYPDRLAFHEIEIRTPILKSVNQGRLKAKVPRKLQQFIEVIRGRGHAMVLPEPAS